MNDRKRNLYTAMLFGSIALAFFVGVMVRQWLQMG
jgi:hypothetical protein